MYEARSSGGVTPLMNAIMSGNPYIVGFCLNHSFNPFMQDYMGQTCLDYAAPFIRVGGGHKISDLLNTAIAQWRSQISEETIVQRSSMTMTQAQSTQFAPFQVNVGGNANGAAAANQT